MIMKEQITGTQRAIRYANDVSKGKILTSRMVRLAVDRFNKDLARQNTVSFPYYFDSNTADRFIQFAESTKLYSDKWAGKFLHLEDWQCFIFANVYGWKKKDGRRRFRKAFLQVARKNGKSSMLAVVLLWDLMMTNGSQCYAGATKRDQSKILFRCLKQTIRQNNALTKRLKIYESTSRIINEGKGGFFEALASDTDKLDGLNPSCAVIDEIGSQKDMGLVNVIESGMVSRPEPLLWEIGSATDNLYSAGKQEHDRAEKILEGIEEDDSFFCMVYELDKEDDWTDETLYKKANPNLGITVDAEKLHDMKIQALSNSSYEGEIRTKCLGQYISPITAWVQPAIWNKCVSNVSECIFDESKPFFSVGAVDLSKRNDLTAFTVCLYQDGKYFLKHKAYFPLEMLEEKMKHDNEMWRKWTEEGIVTGTNGSVVDYRVMFRDIKDMIDEYRLDHILFDPYNSNSLITELQDIIDLVEVPQNIKNLSPFTKRFEEEIYKGNIVDDNPLMRWEMSNAEVYRDANDNLKVVKPKVKESSKRIDNVITSLMCVGRIGSLIDGGDIDLRSNEEIVNNTMEFLNNLNFYDV